jgi:uncharacterized integral membrane protein
MLAANTLREVNVSEPAPEVRGGRNWPALLIAWAVVLALLVVFIVENFITVEVRFLFTRTETRLAYALLIAAGLGFLVGYLLPRLRRR